MKCFHFLYSVHIVSVKNQLQREKRRKVKLISANDQRSSLDKVQQEQPPGPGAVLRATRTAG